MTQEAIREIISEGVFVVLKVAAPPLLMGLGVGLIVSIFQAITSIHEQTLAFIPKIAAVFLSLIIWGNWMLTQLTDFMSKVLSTLTFQ
ncbi:MAG: flagellar biosynthesis protein FliQ [Clostridiales bacterium]|jgi:flagellar biosynthetic protein FliQ|nr:flagellar biosynthesis protein FliQ [Clostridiales bacterium]